MFSRGKEAKHRLKMGKLLGMDSSLDELVYFSWVFSMTLPIEKKSSDLLTFMKEILKNFFYKQ